MISVTDSMTAVIERVSFDNITISSTTQLIYVEDSTLTVESCEFKTIQGQILETVGSSYSISHSLVHSSRVESTDRGLFSSFDAGLRYSFINTTFSNNEGTTLLLLSGMTLGTALLPSESDTYSNGKFVNLGDVTFLDNSVTNVIQMVEGSRAVIFNLFYA